MLKTMIRTAAACVAALALFHLGGCEDKPPGPSGAAETTYERIKKSGVLRVGYANEAPYAYMDSKSGRLTGEAPEVLRVVAGRLGKVEVEGVLTEFGSLIPGLKAGRFDVIAAGMYITPERAREINFCNPTYGIGEAFLVVKGNPLKLHSYEDVRVNGSAKLGVVGGAIERDYARKSGIPDDRVMVFPDAPSALAGLQAGHVDAYAGTSLTARDLLRKSRDGGVELADPFTDPVIAGKSVRGYGAFGVRKEDTQLLEAFNKELAGFIGTPEHLKTVEPFGFGKAEMPGEVTAAQLSNP